MFGSKRVLSKKKPTKKYYVQVDWENQIGGREFESGQGTIEEAEAFFNRLIKEIKKGTEFFVSKRAALSLKNIVYIGIKEVKENGS